MYNTQSIYILRNPAIKSQLQFKLLDMKTFVILLSIFLLVVDGQKKSNGYVSFSFCDIGTSKIFVQKYLLESDLESHLLFVFNRGDTVSQRFPIKGVRPSPYTTLCGPNS